MKHLKNLTACFAAVLTLTTAALAASVYETPAEAATGVTGKTLEEVIAERQSGISYGAIAAGAIAAAKAGANVTHVDASKGMVTWAKENALSSGLANAPIRWIVDDCIKFVEREIRRGSHYDAIIMDPPSYGRGPKGEIWKMEDCIYSFLEHTTQILTPNPLFFLINSYTTGLQPAVLAYMINTLVVSRFGGRVDASEIGLPVSSNGLVLPCGASGRWTSA